jgi:serine/threonine protein kinase
VDSSEAHLTIDAGPGAGTRWIVPDRDLRTVGTHPQAQLRLPELQVRHAVLRYDEVFQVQAFSGAPTAVGQRPCVPGEWTSVRPGDTLSLGPYTFRVELHGLSAATVVGSARTKRLAPQLAPPAYEVQGRLGGGGFGTVYSARRRSDGLEVALKVMKFEPDPVLLARFLRECEVTESFDHPHIVKVVERGLDQFPPFVALELIPGLSAGDVVQAGPLPVARALRLGLGAARAIHALTSRGLVHRDVKPSNILVAEGDVAKLSDFGLVTGIDEVITALTKSKAGMGTFAYAAPEQLDDASQVDPQADVYSLGATLFHLVGGRPPFHLTSVGDLDQVFRQPPPDLLQLRPDCPPALAALTASMLAKAPGDRPTIADVVSALGELLAGR